MSWSLSVPDGDVADFEDAVEKARAAYDETVVTQWPDDQAEATREQMQAAIGTAAQLVRGGVVGDGKVRVSLNGHANAGHHNPTDGWANEMVTVSVTNANTPTG
jgi:hypothetical protein